MSYGQRETSVDIETASAGLLGRLLIGWSRVDIALQLYVAALPRERTGGGGRDWHGRIEGLLAFIDGLPDKDLRADFMRWIVRARQLHPVGTSLRTGRWLPDPRRNLVLVLGEPHAERPAAPSYSLEELEQADAALRSLLAELHRLCMIERGLTAAGTTAFLSTQPIAVVEAP